MTFWALTVREIRRRPGRAALTLLSIVLGVAAVIAVSLATSTTRRAYREMYRTVAGRAALEVTSEKAFDESLVAAVENVPGVKDAVPSLQVFTKILRGEAHVPMLAIGVDPKQDHLVRDYDVEGSPTFDDGTGVILEAGFAAGSTSTRATRSRCC